MGSFNLTEEMAPGGDYTWASSSFSWADPLADREWQYAGDKIIGAEVGEEINLTDANLARLALSRVFVASLALQAARVRSPHVSLTEEVAFAEDRVSATAKNFSVAIAAAEGTQKAFDRRVNVSLALARALDQLRSIDFNETLGIAEVGARYSSRSFNSTLGFSEQSARSPHVVRNVSLKLSEALSRASVKNMSVGVIFEKVRSSGLDRAFDETLSVSEAQSRLLDWQRQFSEALLVDESREPFQTSKTISEEIAAAESFARVGAFDRKFLEDLALAEAGARHSGIVKTEIIRLTESGRSINFIKSLATALGLSEAPSTIRGYIRTFSEAIGFDEMLHKAPVKQVMQSLGLVGKMLRGANAIISDLKVRKAPLSLSEFQTILKGDAPAGYEAFKLFQPGDYRYSKAVIKTTVNRVGSSAPVLDTMHLTVDVPDRLDRGSVSLPAESVHVTFSRPFSTTDELEVTATLKGGTVVAIPRVSNLTKTGFDLVLVDPSTGDEVAGVVSWMAQGY